MSTVTIQGLFTYPLKGGARIEHHKITITPRGPEGDRLFVFCGPDGAFLTQRLAPELAVVQLEAVSVEEVCLRFGAKSWRMRPSGGRFQAKVWDDLVSVQDYGPCPELQFLPVGSRLGRIDWQDPRLVKAKYTSGAAVAYAFADGFPLLVTGEATLKAVNQQILSGGGQEVGMERFRPNIVMSGLEAFEEEDILGLRHSSGAVVRLVKPCQRCVVTTVDQDTGKKMGKEPLVSLGVLRGRLERSGLVFGMNGYLDGAGQVFGVGDRLVVVTQ